MEVYVPFLSKRLKSTVKPGRLLSEDLELCLVLWHTLPGGSISLLTLHLPFPLEVILLFLRFSLPTKSLPKYSVPVKISSQSAF